MTRQDTLTGAQLVEAVMETMWKHRSLSLTGNDARAALRAQAEAAGVTAEGLYAASGVLTVHPWSSQTDHVAALLRALAEVLRDE